MKLRGEELAALRRLKQLIASMTAEELKAFGYIWDNISVGEIIYERDMFRHYGIEKPHVVARRLRELGVVERGEGCYNLARWLRPLRRRIRYFSHLLRLLDKYLVL
ncbi:MAG: hypothetical protein GXO09_03295 [Crenarchaeota archaeon]|nr:hypothetical protein [Thermoproteota archaeon]